MFQSNHFKLILDLIDLFSSLKYDVYMI